jgi:hypothetical protein
MAIAALTVPIDGSTKGLERALRDATTEIQGFSGRIKGTLRGIGGSFAAAFAGLQVARLIGDSITDASNLEESASKAAQIFGSEFMSELETFAAGADTGLGLSEQQVFDAASTFGVFGKAAGLSGEGLVDFSTDFATLAADMASFNNTSPQDAIDAIGAALRGESEPIRRYGVLLDDATLKARAIEEGLWDGEEAWSAQTRSLAAAAEIYAQTGDQQGDFARTSDGLAGQQKILQAQLANVSAEIGAKLLPIAVRLATWFNNEGLPAIQRFGTWLQTNIPPILQAIGNWFERHRETISSVMATIWDVIQRVWSEISRYVSSTLAIIQGAWNIFAGFFRGDWSQFWDGIRGVLGGFWDKVQQAWTLAWDILKFLTGLAWEWIKDKFFEYVDKIKEAVDDGLDDVKEFFEDLPGEIVDALGDLGSMLWDLGTNAIQSLWDAMKAKAEEALAWAGDFAKDMADKIGLGWLVGSPSRVFMELGGDAMDGLQIGLENGAVDNLRTMSGIAGSLTTPFAGGRSGITSMPTAGGMMTVVVEMDGREVARAVERVSERDGGLRIKTRAGG